MPQVLEDMLESGARAGVAELADARDLKSRGGKLPCGFDPRPRHQITQYPVSIACDAVNQSPIH